MVQYAYLTMKHTCPFQRGGVDSICELQGNSLNDAAYVQFVMGKPLFLRENYYLALSIVICPIYIDGLPKVIS